MYQLICHHTYKWAGMGVDLSPYGNDAVGPGGIVLPHGAIADSGALRFEALGHRLTIPRDTAAGERRPSWKTLRALRVEATFRLLPSTGHRLLIAGDRSFAIMLGHSGFLWAGILAPDAAPPIPHPSIPPVAPWQVVWNDPGAEIPSGQWVTLEFEHNGFSRMELRLNGTLIGSSPITFAVPPVGPKGVAIGNSHEGGTPLGGDLDEIRIWRWDPDALRREFLGRPYTPQAAQCWEKVGRAILKMFDSDPECMRRLMAHLRFRFDEMLRIIDQIDPAARPELRALIARYTALWFAGDLRSPEMAKALCDLRIFLTANSRFFLIEHEDFLGESPCGERLRKMIDLDCDPDIQAFFRLLRDALECDGSSAAR